MRDIESMLQSFIDPDDDFKTILALEASEYLLTLTLRFPNARIFAVTTNRALSEDPRLKDLQVEWRFLDYCEEPLPFQKEYFDLVISDLTFEVVGSPQDICGGISSFIKKTGFFFTSFRNIRHWSILKDLMEGKYPGIVSRLYSRNGFEKLLAATFFKQIRYAPIRRKPKKQSDIEIFNRLVECGFENPDDLEAEFWLVRAAKSMPELALLKSMYTEDERQEFAFILHRIEYGIAVHDSVKKFWEFFRSHEMYIDYAALFIHEAVMHRPRFYETLFNESPSEPELRGLIQTAEDVEASFE